MLEPMDIDGATINGGPEDNKSPMKRQPSRTSLRKSLSGSTATLGKQLSSASSTQKNQVSNLSRNDSNVSVRSHLSREGSKKFVALSPQTSKSRLSRKIPFVTRVMQLLMKNSWWEIVLLVKR